MYGTLQNAERRVELAKSLGICKINDIRIFWQWKKMSLFISLFINHKNA